jgi:hypothetical protein
MQQEMLFRGIPMPNENTCMDENGNNIDQEPEKNDTPDSDGSESTQEKSSPENDDFKVSPSTLAMVPKLAGLKDLNELQLYIFDQMMELLKDTPYQAQAVAVSRLSMNASVIDLVKDNTNLISMILHVLKEFEVEVSVVEYSTAMQKNDRRIRFSPDGKYDLRTLQMGIAELISLMNEYKLVAKTATSHKVDLESKTTSLSGDLKRFQDEVRRLQAVPPPPKVFKPYVLMRTWINKSGVLQQRFIAKDKEVGYKETQHITKALRYEDQNSPLKRLIHLCDNSDEYQIKNIQNYAVYSIHYIQTNNVYVEGDIAIALAKARARAEKRNQQTQE